MKNPRFSFIFFFFIIFSATIIGRLIYIQVLNGDLYRALAEGFHLSPDEIQVERGKIFFQNGEPLAINKNWYLVWALPRKIENVEKTAKELSEILQMSESLISKKLNQDVSYVKIKDRLNDEEIELIKNSGLPGIHLDIERGRYYPQENLASQIIGFLGGGGEGQYGLEESYEEALRGEDGISGKDLILTLDYQIQFTAEKLLSEAKDNLNIESGQIIVIEPNSGKILALANFPNFNPNQYREFAQKGELEVFQNSITQKKFEPGSVLKPITFAAALNEEKITPETTYVDEGVVNVGGWPLYNYGGRVYGETPMTEVLEKSINTGAVFVEKQIGNNVFLNYLSRFGFFEETGIDLREILPENIEFKKGYEVNFATASYGQGIEMTPIQLVRAYCAIANGGKLVKPYLVEKILDKDGLIIKETEPKLSENSILSSKANRQLTAMLVNVVENGFATRAQVPGYYIAGKTGTAMISWSALNIKKEGYSDLSWQSFAGWFPAFNPRVLILVKLDKPETKTAEYSAVPVFQKLAEFIINYQQISPDYE